MSFNNKFQTLTLYNYMLCSDCTKMCKMFKADKHHKDYLFSYLSILTTLIIMAI